MGEQAKQPSAAVNKIRKLILMIFFLAMLGLTFLAGNYALFYLSPTDTPIPNFKLPGKLMNMYGGKIHYIDEGAGSYLILLHDIGFSAESMSPLIKELANNYHVLAPDLLGHGYSLKPGNQPYNLNNYSDYLLKFLEKMKVHKAYFVVHGNSSYIIYDFMQRYPEKVFKIIIIDGLPPYHNFIFDKYLDYPLIGEAAVSLINRKILETFLVDYGYNDPSKINLLTIDKLSKYWINPGTKLAYLKTARNMINSGYSNFEPGNKVRGSLLLTEKFNSRVISDVSIARLKEDASPWNVVVIKNHGYFSFLEDPKYMATVIRTHLSY